MPRRVEVRERVHAETLSAALWYGDRFAGGGDAFIEALDAALDDLALYPESHTRVRGNVRRTHLRRFPYLVFFRVRPEVVEVLLLIHAARNPQVWLEVLDAEGWE